MDPVSSPAPDSQAPLPFQVAATSNQPLALHFNARDAAGFSHLLNLTDGGMLDLLPPLTTAVLIFILTRIDAACLPRLIARCSRGWLADRTGRSIGHVARAIHVLEVNGLLDQLEEGGKRGGTGEPSVYELLPSRAPAHRMRLRAAGKANRALARDWGAPAARRRAPDPARRRAAGKETSSIDSVVVVVEQQRVSEMLLSVVDAPTAAVLAKLPKATEAQVRIAIQCLKASSTNVKKPGAFLRKAINEQWAPPQTPEERRVAANPDHVQEDLAKDRQHRAELLAKEAADQKRVAALSDGELEELMKKVLDSTSGFLHKHLSERKASARANVVWVGELVKLLPAKAVK